MPIHFQCGHCGARLTTPQWTRGRGIRCPACGSLEHAPHPARGVDLQALVGQASAHDGVGAAGDDSAFEAENPAGALASLADASVREKPGLLDQADEPRVEASFNAMSANAMNESSASQAATVSPRGPAASAPKMRLAPRDPVVLPPQESRRRVDSPQPLLRSLAWIMRLAAIVLVIMAAAIFIAQLNGGESVLYAVLAGVGGLIAAAAAWTLGEIAAFLCLRD